MMLAMDDVMFTVHAHSMSSNQPQSGCEKY